MKQFPIALQLFSVRDEMEADFEGTLRQVRELGYDGVEFAGLFGRSGGEVKQLCDRLGLTPISAHVTYAQMMDDPAVWQDYRLLGCPHVASATLPPELRPAGGRLDEAIEGLKKLGACAQACGIRLAYHNHDYEFERIDGEYALDRIYREVPAALLDAQLDVGGVNVGGENPADYIRRYAGRVPVLPLKDFVGRRNDVAYALRATPADRRDEVEREFELRPVGCGLQNIPEILAAAEDAGTQWLVVEQDRPSMGLSPLECARKSVEYLRSLY